MPIDQFIKLLENITLHNPICKAEIENGYCLPRSKEQLNEIIRLFSPAAEHRLKNIGSFMSKELNKAHRELRKIDKI